MRAYACRVCVRACASVCMLFLVQTITLFVFLLVVRFNAWSVLALIDLSTTCVACVFAYLQAVEMRVACVCVVCVCLRVCVYSVFLRVCVCAYEKIGG